MGDTAPRHRHIRVEFGPLELNYAADAEQISDVAAQLRRSCQDLVITVDDDLRADLPPLPCAELWD
ncbi:hypothetical protein [Nocardia asteroides]|uniref:hypothetical protein n=1 Tax=Nocardia asteroides TaxID=1824 RepID=UPI001E2FF4B1|nr:hypothetical protein [Nocardia asteroides]UGT60426.1 hypothetical protein LTT61_25050 [Nocardia asteroides]